MLAVLNVLHLVLVFVFIFLSMAHLRALSDRRTEPMTSVLLRALCALALFMLSLGQYAYERSTFRFFLLCCLSVTVVVNGHFLLKAYRKRARTLVECEPPAISPAARIEAINSEMSALAAEKRGLERRPDGTRL